MTVATAPLPSLTALAQRYGTDKRADQHNYVALYDPLLRPLRASARRVLEIGVNTGSSLKLWRDYFAEARIYGIDRDPKRQCDDERIQTFVADAGRREDLERVRAALGGDLDLVVDDGGHRMHEQQRALGVLFPAVRPGGLYIIEDAFSSFPRCHRNDFGVEPDGANTTWAMIERFVRTGVLRSRYLADAECDAIARSIDVAAYYFRPNSKWHSAFWAVWKRGSA